MRASRMVIGVSAVVLIVGAVWIGLRLGDPYPPDDLPHTVFTEERLREFHGQAPRPGLFLPADLPESVIDAIRSDSVSADQTSFELMNVLIESERPRRNRSVETIYVSDVLSAPHDGARFRVTQTFIGAEPLSATCPDRPTMPSVVREVRGSSVRICSMALREGSAARDYWSTVELTADLTKVGWLWE